MRRDHRLETEAEHLGRLNASMKNGLKQLSYRYEPDDQEVRLTQFSYTAALGSFPVQV